MSLGRFIWFVFTALSLALVYVFLTTPMHTRSAANEASAVGTARSLYRLNEEFHRIHGRYASGSEELSRALDVLLQDAPDERSRMRDKLMNEPRGAYICEYALVARVSGEFGYYIRLRPAEPGKSGKRSFYVDETGIIRYSEKPDVGPASPALQ
jgi:hypothetical protein